MNSEIAPVNSGAEVQLISDGAGLAVIGDKGAVERFLSSHSLESRDLGLARLSGKISAASNVAQTGAETSKNFGRWVQLTEKSARELEKYGAMKGSTSEVSRAIVMDKGKIKGIAEFVKSSPKNVLTNPALLTGAAGLMAQLAMEQAMDEITDYLAKIDAKVNDVLRAQKDAALAGMIGVDFAIQEALAIRHEVGRVSDITWSKVQSTSVTIGQTQAYALRRLDALAEKLERTTNLNELAELSKDAEIQVQEWLAVIARSFQLQDGIAVLELDRVLDAAPDELERHRRGLHTARANRLDLISTGVNGLLNRIEAAGHKANRKVLLQPIDARTVVNSGQRVIADVVVFQQSMGVEAGDHALHGRRWRDAAADARDRAIEVGAHGVGAVKRAGLGTADWAKAAAEKVSDELAERVRPSGRDELEIEDEVPWVLQVPEDED